MKSLIFVLFLFIIGDYHEHNVRSHSTTFLTTEEFDSFETNGAITTVIGDSEVSFFNTQFSSSKFATNVVRLDAPAIRIDSHSQIKSETININENQPVSPPIQQYSEVSLVMPTTRSHLQSAQLLLHSHGSQSATQSIQAVQPLHNFTLINSENYISNCSLSEHKCLPSFLIAGTQKSGTTALAAILSGHSNILFALRKEVHYFDKTDSYTRGIDYYLKSFKSWNQTERLQPPVYAEATPYYIASRQACQRIIHTIPHVKMIILLRNPVHRAYSEYQMKLRRVEQQNEFFNIITKYQSELHDCMLKHRGDLIAIKECVPTELGMHSRWNKLKAALSRFYDKSDQNWNAVMKGCFMYSATTHLNSYTGFNVPQWLDSKHAVGVKRIEYVNGYGDIVSDNIDDTNFNASQTQQLQLQQSRPLHTSAHTRSINTPLMTHKNKSNLLPTLPTTAHIHTQQSTPIFNLPSCWRYNKEGFEELQSLHSAFEGEIEAFKQCGGMTLKAITELYLDKNWIDMISDKDFQIHMDILNTLVNKCIKVRTGISTQYFYRSLYVVQLYHCFQNIPRDQFLIIPSERLRKYPSDVVDTVLQFVGLQTSTSHVCDNTSVISDNVVASTTCTNTDTLHQQSSVIDTSQETINLSILQHFPVFEKSTGWKLNSQYQPMPTELHTYLTEFFMPYNNMLLKLFSTTSTGETIQDEW